MKPLFWWIHPPAGILGVGVLIANGSSPFGVIGLALNFFFVGLWVATLLPEKGSSPQEKGKPLS